MDNEGEQPEEEAMKKAVSSGISNCLSATDTQDEEELMARVLTKTEEEVKAGAPRDNSETNAAKSEKTGRAKRREKRLKNEPQNVLLGE